MFRLITYKNNRLPNGYRFIAFGLLTIGPFDLFYVSSRRSTRGGIIYVCIRLLGFEVLVAKNGVSVGFCGNDLILRMRGSGPDR